MKAELLFTLNYPVVAIHKNGYIFLFTNEREAVLLDYGGSKIINTNMCNIGGTCKFGEEEILTNANIWEIPEWVIATIVSNKDKNKYPQILTCTNLCENNVVFLLQDNPLNGTVIYIDGGESNNIKIGEKYPIPHNQNLYNGRRQSRVTIRYTNELLNF